MVPDPSELARGAFNVAASAKERAEMGLEGVGFAEEGMGYSWHLPFVEGRMMLSEEISITVFSIGNVYVYSMQSGWSIMGSSKLGLTVVMPRTQSTVWIA